MNRAIKALTIMIILSFVIVGIGYAGPTIKPQVKVITGSGQVRVGSTNIKAINFYSSTAGDQLGVYSSASEGIRNDELVFEMAIASNTCSASLNTGVEGVDIGNGVYVKSNNANAVATIIYDY